LWAAAFDAATQASSGGIGNERVSVNEVAEDYRHYPRLALAPGAAFAALARSSARRFSGGRLGRERMEPAEGEADVAFRDG
jgi:hypothetical protein